MTLASNSKIAVSMLITFLSSIVSIFVFNTFKGLIISALILAVGIIRIDKKSKLFNFIWVLTVIAGTSIAAEYGLGIGYIWIRPIRCALIDFAVIACIMLLFFTISLNLRFSVIAGSFVIILIYYIDYLVYSYRGKEVMPIDLLSIRTAINVAEKYPIIINRFFYLAFLFWVLLVYTGFSISIVKFSESNIDW